MVAVRQAAPRPGALVEDPRLLAPMPKMNTIFCLPDFDTRQVNLWNESENKE